MPYNNEFRGDDTLANKFMAAQKESRNTSNDDCERIKPKMRAKFKLHSRLETADYTGQQLVFTAVTGGSHEDQTFNKYTPCGTLTMNVDNPIVLAQLELGKAYYLDFTPAE